MGSLEVSQLKAFGKMNQMKKAALTVVASQLTDERLEGLKQTFMTLDENADGTLSMTEIKEGMKRSGVALPKDLEELLLSADTDGSGVVDYTEFLAATMDKKIYHQEDVVWSAFRKFDTDNSGTIDKKELAKIIGQQEVQEVMHINDTSEVEEIFSQVDSNGDGQIDFDEFLNMMRAAEGGKKTKSKARHSVKNPELQPSVEVGLGRKASGSPRPVLENSFNLDSNSLSQSCTGSSSMNPAAVRLHPPGHYADVMTESRNM